MEFQHYDLGQLYEGRIVIVTISGSSANVKLMDSSNFQNYKSGRKHSFYGGHVKSSPFKISIPSDGSWYITIDLGGFSGKLSSSVKVI
jgi:hypothetical protein